MSGALSFVGKVAGLVATVAVYAGAGEIAVAAGILATPAAIAAPIRARPPAAIGGKTPSRPEPPAFPPPGPGG